VRYSSFVAWRELAKRYLPAGAVKGIQRRLALRRYLRSISYELSDRSRTIALEELEGEVLSRRPDMTKRVTQDVLLRTDLLIQQLDRKIEGLRTRSITELRDLRQAIEEIRSDLEALQAAIREDARVQFPAGGPAGE
jgi:hypothetical protein